MSSTIVTARINADLANRLDALASDHDRSRAWMVARAIARFVDEEEALVGAIKEGEADIAAGRVVSQAVVEKMFGVSRGERHAA